MGDRAGRRRGGGREKSSLQEEVTGRIVTERDEPGSVLFLKRFTLFNVWRSATA